MQQSANGQQQEKHEPKQGKGGWKFIDDYSLAPNAEGEQVKLPFPATGTAEIRRKRRALEAAFPLPRALR